MGLSCFILLFRPVPSGTWGGYFEGKGGGGGQRRKTELSLTDRNSKDTGVETREIYFIRLYWHYVSITGEQSLLTVTLLVTIHLSFHPPTHLLTYLPVCPTYLSTCPFVSLSDLYLPTYLSICLSVCLSVY